MNGAARVIRAVSDELEAAGLRARIIARDLDSGTQVSLAPDGLVPLASVAKVPIALAVLTRISYAVFCLKKKTSHTPLCITDEHRAPENRSVPHPLRPLPAPNAIQSNTR